MEWCRDCEEVTRRSVVITEQMANQYLSKLISVLEY